MTMAGRNCVIAPSVAGAPESGSSKLSQSPGGFRAPFSRQIQPKKSAELWGINHKPWEFCLF